MANFEKVEFDRNFDYESQIKNEFLALGFKNTDVQTSFTNGLSHYVYVVANVGIEGKLPMSVFVWENGTVRIIVRISDHNSGLENNSRGVSGNTMTMDVFKKLIEVGAIKKDI